MNILVNCMLWVLLTSKCRKMEIGTVGKAFLWKVLRIWIIFFRSDLDGAHFDPD